MRSARIHLRSLAAGMYRSPDEPPAKSYADAVDELHQVTATGPAPPGEATAIRVVVTGIDSPIDVTIDSGDELPPFDWQLLRRRLFWAAVGVVLWLAGFLTGKL